MRTDEKIIDDQYWAVAEAILARRRKVLERLWRNGACNRQPWQEALLVPWGDTQGAVAPRRMTDARDSALSAVMAAFARGHA